MASVFGSLQRGRAHARAEILASFATPLDETQRLSEAQTAVRAMPIKKVLPRLLNLVEAKDDPVSVWMTDKSDKFRVQFLKWHSAEDFQQLGIAGFEVLGSRTVKAPTKQLCFDRQLAFFFSVRTNCDLNL